MNLPNTHFLLCSYLVSGRLQADDPLSLIFLLADLLEQANFKSFWIGVARCRELVDLVPGFDDAIRNFITGLIGITYQTISFELLGEAVNMGPGSNELNELIAAKGWKVNGTFAVIPPNEELQSKSKKVGESRKFGAYRTTNCPPRQQHKYKQL